MFYCFRISYIKGASCILRQPIGWNWSYIFQPPGFLFLSVFTVASSNPREHHLGGQDGYQENYILPTNFATNVNRSFTRSGPPLFNVRLLIRSIEHNLEKLCFTNMLTSLALINCWCDLWSSKFSRFWLKELYIVIAELLRAFNIVTYIMTLWGEGYYKHSFPNFFNKEPF